MNVRAMRAIVRKDLLVVLQSKPVLLPIIILPAILLILLPLLATLLPGMIALPESDVAELMRMLEQMPGSMQQTMEGHTTEQKVVMLLVLYLFAPLYLIVPMMVASVIAADSFAGEKERKTLEALLYTPTRDEELYTAKLLAAWLPALAVSLGGFVLYGLVANLGGWPVMGRIFFPNLLWVILAFWVAPAVAALGLAATVLVSSKVKTFQEAFQLGGVIVLPLVALIIGQAAGVVYLSAGVAALMGAAIWAVDGVLLYFGIKTFRRGEIIAKL